MSRGLGGVNHPLKRVEAPAFEVAHGVFQGGRAAHHRPDRLQRHSASPQPAAGPRPHHFAAASFKLLGEHLLHLVELRPDDGAAVRLTRVLVHNNSGDNLRP